MTERETEKLRDAGAELARACREGSAAIERFIVAWDDAYRHEKRRADARERAMREERDVSS